MFWWGSHLKVLFVGSTEENSFGKLKSVFEKQKTEKRFYIRRKTNQKGKIKIKMLETGILSPEGGRWVSLPPTPRVGRGGH
jgi:hypothetical protein